MSEDSVNRTNATIDVNATISETKNTSLPEEITETSPVLLDSASLIGIFVAVGAVLFTIGERTYGFAERSGYGIVKTAL